MFAVFVTKNVMVNIGKWYAASEGEYADMKVIVFQAVFGRGG